MQLQFATREFERWLAELIPLDRRDLAHKHEAMGADAFSFFRATYYRWTQRIEELGRELSQSPRVLAVGDLHVENFGTWRDALGRLAWGINDFDEAYPLPYTHDLLRLVTSALLAIQEHSLEITGKSACRSIVEGYREGLAVGGKPFVIGEEHRWFKPILQSPERDPGMFWDKLRALPRERRPVPAAARAAIVAAMPARNVPFEVSHRIAGLGNLGKPRYTAIAAWQGGPVAREAKAVTLSAAAWAARKSDGPYYQKILAGSVRCADPFLQVNGAWIVRRLAPDCRRIELAALDSVRDREWLLHAMGFETANVHLGTSRARTGVATHLKKLNLRRFLDSARMMVELTQKDFRRWRKG